MQGYIRNIAHSIIYACVAAILASNYFLFQIELFEDEYEANHPLQTERSDGISRLSVTWESFDKDHAQKPFVVKAMVEIQCLVRLHTTPIPPVIDDPPHQLVRDKSPPQSNLIFSIASFA